MGRGRPLHCLIFVRLRIEKGVPRSTRPAAFAAGLDISRPTAHGPRGAVEHRLRIAELVPREGPR
eukprot:2633574-Pyramimonas_sp.AAC.1